MASNEWSDIKPLLQKQTPSRLLSVIGELYRFSEDNKHFLNTRFSSGLQPSDRLIPYKKRIKEALDSDALEAKIQLQPARRAISDYTKASKDEEGTIELMLYYMETASKVTCEYGDMWEGFYDSIISMGNRLAEKLEKRQDSTLREELQDRFQRLLRQSEGIGWGYHDYMMEFYERLYG